MGRSSCRWRPTSATGPGGPPGTSWPGTTSPWRRPPPRRRRPTCGTTRTWTTSSEPDCQLRGPAFQGRALITRPWKAGPQDRSLTVALFDEHPLSDLDKKAHEVLGDKVVVKSLAQQAAFQGLPRYVSEYLIAKYVKPDTWRDDLAKMQAKVKELLPDLEHRELLKERLLARGEVTLIDSVEVRVDLKGGQRWGRLPALGDAKVRVPAALTEQHPGLLLGGLWGTAKV